jgi:hypothetical protein
MLPNYISIFPSVNIKKNICTKLKISVYMISMKIKQVIKAE